MDRLEVPRLSTAERDRRWARVRQLMATEGMAAIVTSPNTSSWDQASAYTRYLSSIGGNNVGASVVFPAEGEVTAVVSPVPGPEHWLARQEWVTDVRDFGLGWSFADRVLERLKEIGVDQARIGLAGLAGQTRSPEGTFIHGLYEKIREAFPHAELANATDVIEQARYVKGQEEIAALRRSVELAEAMVATLEREARPGVPENVVYGRMMSTLVEQGGEIPTMLLWSAGPRQTRNAFMPTYRKLQAGDIITAEIDGRYLGYNGQATVHAFLGKVPPLYREMHAIQQEAVARCYELLKPGAVLGDFGPVSEEAVKGTRFSCRILMHGRGLGDDPPIAIFNARNQRMASWPIEENAAFIVKPMVSTAGPSEWHGDEFVYWGETAVATRSGAMRLATRPAELIEIS
jgi:Xaa-Pro dipeptidase